MDKSAGLILRIGLLVLLALTLVLRVGPLGNEAIDGDELYTLEFAASSLSENIESLLDDGAHPPLHYVLGAVTVRAIGYSPWAIRILSVFASLAAVALIVLWVFRVTRAPWPALTAGLLVAASPEAIYFGQQGRSYSLYALLVFGMIVSLYSALVGPEERQRRAWWAFGALVFASVMTHYVAALYVAASGIAVLVFKGRGKNIRAWCLAIAPGMLSLAVWLLAVRQTAIRADHGIAESITWRTVPAPFALLEVVAKHAGLAAVDGGTSLALGVTLGLGAWIAWKGLGWLGSEATNPEEPRVRTGEPRLGVLLLIAIIAAVPPALLFLVAQPPVAAPVWGHRHLFPSHMPFVAFFTIGLWWATARKPWPYLGAIAPLVLLVVAALATQPSPRRIPFHTLAEYLLDGGAHDQAAPVLATEHEMIGRPLQHYLGSDLTVRRLGEVPVTSRFWLLHRELFEHSPVLDSLEAEGWVASSERHFGDESGPTAWEMLRK